MSLSCYVHIPYCIQKCRFCDFTTFTQDKLPPPEVYTSWVKQEIDQRHRGIKDRNLRSIYFGGGTPSLIPAKEIISIIEYLKKYFLFHPNIEISIEINPGTLTKESLLLYQSSGINRFSVGVQTFRDDLLKLFNREHSSTQTKKTLELLSKNKVVFSTDLLFALNYQNRDDLKKDLDLLLSYKPHHISAYYLTLPVRHSLQKNRASESIQLQMFHDIKHRLTSEGFDHYEVSNFARKSFHSKHNLAYWLDLNYWGLGLSAHSFLKINGQRVRFWNPKNLKLYSKQVEEKTWPFPFSMLPKEQKETLTLHEALSDFCHTALRTRWGIQQEKLRSIFGNKALELVLNRLKNLQKTGWIKQKGTRWYLPFSSWLISNSIFREMTFLEEDFDLNNIKTDSKRKNPQYPYLNT